MQRLVYPLNTVLDDSIGCAVWFAARGQGHVQNEGGELRPYNSTARVRKLYVRIAFFPFRIVKCMEETDIHSQQMPYVPLCPCKYQWT